MRTASLFSFASPFSFKPLIAALALVAGATGAGAQQAPDVRPPETPVERMSYASGVAAVRNFATGEVPFDADMMIRGIRDALSGQPLALSDKEIRTALNGLQSDLRRAQVRSNKAAAEKNARQGLDFMAAYKKRPGVQTLPNGVAYTVIKAGHGPQPVETDSVIVRYRGTLIDGTEFDATEGDQTATLRVLQTIMGWREALKAMPVGSAWQIVVPHLLAYGERGAGGVIGPNQTLVFDIELVGIKPVQ